MSKLITASNIEQPDDFYQLLTDMTLGLSDHQVCEANARLILLLCNHIGELPVLQEAITAASSHLHQ